MSEWLKEHAWKACVGETLPWVRIPLSPPAFARLTHRRAAVGKPPSCSFVCVNLANLMLARHAGRRRDQAVRAALGASRRALVAETMTESLVLAFAGGAFGLGAAWSLTRLIVTTAPAALPTSMRSRSTRESCSFA